MRQGAYHELSYDKRLFKWPYVLQHMLRRYTENFRKGKSYQSKVMRYLGMSWTV